MRVVGCRACAMVAVMRLPETQARRVNGHVPRRGHAASGQPGGATSGAGAPRTGGPAGERAEPRARAAFRCAPAHAVHVPGRGAPFPLAVAGAVIEGAKNRACRRSPASNFSARAKEAQRQSPSKFLAVRPRVRVRVMRARVRIRGLRARERPQSAFSLPPGAISLKPQKIGRDCPFLASLLSRNCPVYHHLTFDRNESKMDA